MLSRLVVDDGSVSFSLCEQMSMLSMKIVKGLTRNGWETWFVRFMKTMGAFVRLKGITINSKWSRRVRNADLECRLLGLRVDDNRFLDLF